MEIKFLNLPEAQAKAYETLKDTDNGPKDPATLDELKKRLIAAKDTLPPIYRSSVYDPFVAFVNGLTTDDFKKLVQSDGFVLFDIAQAILQNADKYRADATDAFEEMVSDLYDGFLSAEDRHNIKLPDHNLLPPLVKWGNYEAGPYTWTSETTAACNIRCTITNLPPSHAKGALVGWGCLAHEVTGHDILHADDGLLDEMAGVVNDGINANKQIKSAAIRSLLADYWSERIDETASDIMGVLNIGPAAAASMIPYFRALLASFGAQPKLRCEGPASDEHPADILRVMLGSSAVKLLSFKDKGAWASAILAEGMKDLTTIYLNGIKVDASSAQKSADIAAKKIIKTKFTMLGGHSLFELQDWADTDEKIVEILRKTLKTGTLPQASIMEGAYAAHVVSAAIYEALLVKQPLDTLFANMVNLLKQMHDKNPCWGPWYVMHPGDIKRKYIINK